MGLRAYLKYRLWAGAQYPDPELVYARGGIFGVVALLKQCASPDVTKDVLRRFGADIHPRAFGVGPWITLHEVQGSFANLSIGAFAHVGKEVFIDLSDRVVIGASAAIGMRCVILTHLNLGAGYPDKPTARLIPKREKPTVIERGASVGAGSIVLCGVTIGEDAVVGAGVVVAEDVPPRTILPATRAKEPYRIPDRFFRRLAGDK